VSSPPPVARVGARPAIVSQGQSGTPRVGRPADGVVGTGSNSARVQKWVRRGSARRASEKTVSYPTALVATLQQWGQTPQHAAVGAVLTLYETDYGPRAPDPHC
jgi:hypothetical protein